MTTSHHRASDMRTDLKKAAKLGRGGDDRIAHINSYEAAVLRGLGGAGSTNPDTGLEEYKYGGNVSEGGKTQGGSEKGGQGPSGRGGGSFGGGPSSVGQGLSSRERNLRDIENLAAGRPSALAGASGKPGANQGGRGGNTFNGQNVPGNPSAPGYLDYDSQTTMVNGKPVKVGELRSDYHDYAGLGDSIVDQIGNFIAGAFGFSEDNPFSDKDYADGTNPTGRGSNWSWDPVPAIVGLGSTLAGIPAGPGYIAGLISNQLGKPLAFDLGPSAFTSDTLDPETGEVIGSSTTHAGSNMTVRDNDNPDTYYGMSPDLGALAGGASNTIPTRKTFMGTDPSPVDEEPAAPFTPTQPAPTPIDTPPNSPIQVDVGNSQLSPTELTNLFAGFMAPGRTSRGRNAGRVIV